MATQPTAVFMAFGTKGDVYPIAAIAAAFADDQVQYRVALVTHAAHESLREHLMAKNVAYFPVLSPPVLSPSEDHDTAGTERFSFSLQKRKITREHRQECLIILEKIFGDGPSMEGDLIVINFFALEGWSLAELFNVRCVVTAPYVVPYSAPSSFERKFRKELPLLHEYLQEAPADKICWKDVIHWMWPLFSEDWGSWRANDLKLSPWPLMDPVTGIPAWHDRPSSPLLLYGFSKEVVECPGYWPSNVRACGFWFLPMNWQFSCNKCSEFSALVSSGNFNMETKLCSAHTELQYFLETPASLPPVFISLSSIGSMGFLRKPRAFLHVLQTVLDITEYNFVLFSAGYGPLDAAIQAISAEASSGSQQRELTKNGISIIGGRLLCFSGSIPYKWLFSKCVAAIHHGGRLVILLFLSSSLKYLSVVCTICTTLSYQSSACCFFGFDFLPVDPLLQRYMRESHRFDLSVLCPFMLDQFYWAERMFWLGVAPEPLKRNQLLPDDDDHIGIQEAANILAKAIDYALCPEVKARASEIAERLSFEDGVSEAVKILKEELRSHDEKRNTNAS